jgi:pimeloyl-ACP methyl ester carboxylesterase
LTRARLRRLSLAALLLAAPFLGTWVHHWLLAASIFLRLEQAGEPGWLVHYREHEVSTREFAGGRLYQPRDQARAPGILLPHGMHEDGIDDKRMINFARAIAGAGFSVLTPRVEGLAHYRLVREDVLRIAAAARALAEEIAAPRVTVFGISFGGGLAIRAACEPGTAGAIARVVALGAHHDAERVARFYLGEPASGPDGQPARVQPHPYGRVALWMSLFAERHKGTFSEAERARALAGVEATRATLAQASPRSCPGPLAVPLFLAHGSGDRVVPYTETLWNERQFAPQVPVRTVISPAIVHAEYDPPSWSERVSLIAFMVDALW